jgi:anti-sigma factor RsiW
MTQGVIQLPGNDHRDIFALLPWYVNDTLDEGDRARVELHVNHCAECQAEVRREVRLAEEIDALPMQSGDIDAAWARMKRQLDEEVAPAAPRRAWFERLRAALFGEPAATRGMGWLGWVAAAQFAAILVLGGALLSPPAPARYHALSATPVDAAANLIVIFRPETREEAFRGILRANNARIVGGPTSAHAYLLHVPAVERAKTVEKLRRQPSVVLAEPLDGDGP